MKELVTSIEIDVPVARVWKILTDFAHYGDWNPFLYRVEGKAGPDERVDIHYWRKGKESTLKCKIVEWQPGRMWRQTWHIGFPGLYRGEHTFTVEPMGDNRTRFVQREVFSGLLLPTMEKEIDTDTRDCFESMDKALKVQSEHITVSA